MKRRYRIIVFTCIILITAYLTMPSLFEPISGSSNYKSVENSQIAAMYQDVTACTGVQGSTTGVIVTWTINPGDICLPFDPGHQFPVGRTRITCTSANRSAHSFTVHVYNYWLRDDRNSNLVFRFNHFGHYEFQPCSASAPSIIYRGVGTYSRGGVFTEYVGLSDPAHSTYAALTIRKFRNIAFGSAKGSFSFGRTYIINDKDAHNSDCTCMFILPPI